LYRYAELRRVTVMFISLVGPPYKPRMQLTHSA
jgi:hypothetical protein